jgi:hypothetical protein
MTPSAAWPRITYHIGRHPLALCAVLAAALLAPFAYAEFVLQPACERVYGGPRLMVTVRLLPKPACLWSSAWIVKPVPKQQQAETKVSVVAADLDGGPRK